MRISSDTRLASVRHCANKLPVLLLLYLLCPDPTPLRSTLYALVLLIGVVRPLVLTLDESLARSLLANPFPRLLPPPHRSHSHRTPLRRDWSKRVARLGWRARSIWQRGRFPLLGLLLAGLVLLAVPIVDLVSNFQTLQQEREPGWSVVTGQWLIRRINVGAAEAGSANTARGWKPLRNVVWLEILDALACVLHGLLPLLIHLRLLPPTLSGSFLLTDSEDQSRHDTATGHGPNRKSPPPPPSSASSSSAAAALPSLRFPTSHLLSSFHLAILSPSLTLLQILQLVLARSPSTHKWFGGFWTTLVFLVAIILPLDAIAVIRERSTREAERLLEIGQTFAAAAGDHGGGGRGGKGVGANDGDEDELEDHWICSICLRGSGDSPEEDAPPGDGAAQERDKDNSEKQTITFDTRCHLPCAHSFHAHCLATWFSTVSSCPTCHRTINRPTPTSPSSSSIPGNSTLRPSPAAAVASSRSSPFTQARPVSVSEPYFTQDAIERARLRAESEAREQQDQYPGAAAAAARDRRRAALFGPSPSAATGGGAQGVARTTSRTVDLSALFPPSLQRLGGRSTSTNSSEAEEGEL